MSDGGVRARCVSSNSRRRHRRQRAHPLQPRHRAAHRSRATAPSSTASTGWTRSARRRAGERRQLHRVLRPRDAERRGAGQGAVGPRRLRRGRCRPSTPTPTRWPRGWTAARTGARAATAQVDPGPDEIFTIRLRNGDTYRLVGLHIMTKELRHWQWITLWWSDRPDARLRRGPPGRHPRRARPGVEPLQDVRGRPGTRGRRRPGGALRRGRADPGRGAPRGRRGAGRRPTWCSNPYIEHGPRQRAHQLHRLPPARRRDRSRTTSTATACSTRSTSTASSTTSCLPGRRAARSMREVFPADYLYSFNRVDDFSHDDRDRGRVLRPRRRATRSRPRVEAVLSLTGDPAGGEAIFGRPAPAATAPTAWAPRARRACTSACRCATTTSIVRTLIQGRGGMPSLGRHLRRPRARGHPGVPPSDVRRAAGVSPRR